MSTRLTITWDYSEGRYKCSIPNFEGAEVVLASEFDALRSKLDSTLAVLRNIRLEPFAVSVTIGKMIDAAIAEAEKVSKP